MRFSDAFNRVVRDLRPRQPGVGEKPFVVAFSTGDAFSKGDRLTRDTFYDVLETYDSVIVHWKEGAHPSQKDHYLLYGEAADIDVMDERVDSVRARTRSKELIGEFAWFKHGQGLAVDLSIGLHCKDAKTFTDLP